MPMLEIIATIMLIGWVIQTYRDNKLFQKEAKEMMSAIDRANQEVG